MLEPLQTLDFKKYRDGLVPAVVQDYRTQKLITLGFMNEEALKKTEESGLVTFYSRKEKKLWTTKENTGHSMSLRQILVNCNKDSLLLKVDVTGPVCHTGADTCWSERNHSEDFLLYLEHIIELERRAPDKGSYAGEVQGAGPGELAQLIGKESIALGQPEARVNRELFLRHAANLLFHYIVLLQTSSCSLAEVISVLEQRHQSR